MSGPGLASALTSEQEEAVRRRRGSLLLAAGAGSGKTAVLVERFVQAVLEDDVAPSAILAITFTERAAWEMRQRMRMRLRELGERDLARDLQTALIGTFHGFCARLLRSDPFSAGIAPGFAVLADGVASRLRREAFEEALRAVIAQRSEQAVDLAAAYGVDRLRGIVIGVHEQLRSRGQSSPALPATATGSGSAATAQAELACELIGLLLSRFGEAYQAGKLRRGAVDFDDLELGALRLLQASAALREQWAQRFELIMVDEFQDTNPRQLELLAAIERENVFMVGDEWQSIYGFRHADVSIFRERSVALARQGGRLALTLSFRSVPGVIDAVNSVFRKRFGESYTPLRASRERSEGAGAVEVLLTERNGWGEDPMLAARVGEGLPEASLWRQAEARHIAKRVDDLLGQGRYGPGDVAVLLRATKDLYVYERALAARGVPTLATAGGFWDGAEVRDMLAYLRALANPLDEIALYGVLASPLVGLSSDSLALIARRAQSERPAGLWRALQGLCDPSAAGEQMPGPDGAPRSVASSQQPGSQSSGDGAVLSARALLSGRDGDLLVGFCGRFRSERRTVSERSLARVIAEAVGASGYLDRICGGRDALRAEANIRKLARLATDYERIEGCDLRGFIDHAEHLAQEGAGSEPDAPITQASPGAVRLMSIHAAKGLEFPVVCVADLGRAPRGGASPDMIVEGDRVGLRLLRLEGGDPQPEMAYEELLAALRQAEAQEEDRILYVAMTRARDLLLISGACRLRRRRPASAPSAPIDWLAPALIEDLERRLEAAGDQASGCSPRTGDGGGPRLLLYGPWSAETALPARAGARPVAGPGERAPGATTYPGEADEMHRTPAGRRREPGGGSSGAQMARAAPVSGSLSYTSLTRLERCGYRHYLEAVLGMQEQQRTGGARAGARPSADSPPAGQARAAMVPPAGARATGELAHAVLQRMDFSSGCGPEPGEIAVRARELGIEVSQDGCRQLAELLGGLPGTDLAGRIAAAAQRSTEQPFAFSIGGDQPLIVGTFDLLAREPDGACLIVDYKSGGLDGDLEELVRAEFGAQRLIYALAALADGAEQVEVVHWFLRRPDHPVSARFGSGETQALTERLRDRIEGVRARGFAVSERPHRGLCAGCPGRSRLCSWSERETLRARPVS